MQISTENAYRSFSPARIGNKNIYYTPFSMDGKMFTLEYFGEKEAHKFEYQYLLNNYDKGEVEIQRFIKFCIWYHIRNPLNEELFHNIFPGKDTTSNSRYKTDLHYATYQQVNKKGHLQIRQT
ncbi:hypothetical protein CDAR_408991 [Caerostris darwini]|uniref:LAGLIDADG homing endonuclease n=1 Tax=Caerostris darwini TaxID=1538125 RepID=A0AAV4P898_9ARAC|nr:hypothetical protein CDAR_408991 [Caerostris darwini]